MTECRQFLCVASFSFATIFLIPGLLIFLPFYISDLQHNDGYTGGTCVYEPGYIVDTTCGSSIWKVECWFAMVGLSAVKNVTAYIPFGPYRDLSEAENVLQYEVGSVFGHCYYKNGGESIVLSITDSRKDLITFIVLIVIGLMISGLAFIGYCLTRKRMNYTPINEYQPGTIV